MKLAIRRSRISVWLLIGSLWLGSFLTAQQLPGQQTSEATVPRLVRFSGKALDGQGNPLVGSAMVSFAIYKNQLEETPLWMETQSIQADAKGNYTVQLGAGSSEGLPLDLFTSGEARWLGARVNGGSEQPRVVLVSVPYALKAADAQTLGGLPASAFQLAVPPPVIVTSGPSVEAMTLEPSAVGTKPVTTAGGTAQTLAKFDANADITNSQIFDNGTNVGIGNTAPGAKLDVSGTSIFRGALTLPSLTAATATGGKSSQPLNFTASVFNSGTAKAVNETFRWQAEPVGNNTTTPLGKLNLLFGSGTATPAETGLSISNKGIISFAAGQTFPGGGTGSGTVKSVGLTAPPSDFSVSGSPVTSSGSLNLQWLVPPTFNNTPNAIVKRDTNGNFSAGTIFANTIEANFIDGRGPVRGDTTDPGGFGFAAVLGVNRVSGAVEGDGVSGLSLSNLGAGVVGQNTVSGFGVVGQARGSSGQGVWGESFGTQFSANGSGPDGVDGISHSSLGSGVAAVNTTSGDGLFAQSNGGFAAFFLGDVDVDGHLSKASGSFKIDHPLDPANKYLYHSFVESPDMMNVYNGNVVTDGQGKAVVQMPEWFEALNRDFRYQLTVIGQFAQAMVASEMANDTFTIQTDKPNVKVSWQVTGIRQDAYANAHRVPVEQVKPEKEQGLYLHPELFGAPEEKSITAIRHAGVMKMVKESKARQTDSTKQ